MTADVTVIVVGYNHAAYVEECLESIRSQGSRLAAVIVADDASTDDSRDVIEAYKSAHPGFLEFYSNDHNRGLTWTLNRALSRVRTTYVTYIAADDLMLPSRIASQAAVMDSTQAELSYTDAVVIDARSEILHATSKAEFPWPSAKKLERGLLACLFEGNWIPAASIMMKTKALNAIGGYDERIFFEDYELLTRAASRGWRFSALDEPLVAVRRLRSSLGATGFRGGSLRFILAHDAALRHFPSDRSSLARHVASARWELAKRMAKFPDMNRVAKVRRLWDARAGAANVLTFAYHCSRALLL